MPPAPGHCVFNPELLQGLDSFGSTARSSYLERCVTAQGQGGNRAGLPGEGAESFTPCCGLGTFPWVELLQPGAFVQSV